MTRLASALLVAKRVMNLGIMAWCVPHCVALEGRAYRDTMPCDAIFDTAASAGLAPLKEERALLPGNNRRPADILLRHRCGGKDAALDVTITLPLKSDNRAGAALTPGHAASVTFENKMRGAAELCRAEGLAFVPIVAESLGGFHPVAIEQLKRIASALARHTAQEESEAIHHLLSRCSLLLQRGTASPLIIHFSHLPLY